MNIQDILPGKSYACKYKDLVGTECVAVIHTRDIDNKLVRVCDVDSEMMMTLEWSECYDVDLVDWQEQEV